MSLDLLKWIPTEQRPGKHPSTGQLFVRGEMVSTMDYQELQSPPPRAPTYAVYEYSEFSDTMVHVRDLTDMEFAEAQVEYEKAAKEWYETGGLKRVVLGGPRTTGLFYTASGAWAEGLWDPDNKEWHWSRHSHPVPKESA